MRSSCDTIPVFRAELDSGGAAGPVHAVEHPPSAAVRRFERFLAYSDRNRAQMLAWAAVMVSAILVLDWKFVYRSIGFLYIIPILLISGWLSNWQIAGLAIVCALLREQFTPGHWGPDAAFRLITGGAGFALTGFIVSALHRERQLVVEHLQRREEQIRLREDAEQQIKVLIETSPLAIFTLDAAGCVRLANESAHALLGFTPPSLIGEPIDPWLPILRRLIRSAPSERGLRTVVECRGQRRSGEFFLADMWLSTWMTNAGLMIAAVVWDSSENIRNREDTGLDSMMAMSRVVIGSVSHEIRNLASAGLISHQQLALLPGVDASEQYRALGAILQGLENIAGSGLRAASKRTSGITELGTVLDETRIVIDESVREGGGSIRWSIPPDLPLVQIDHHNLLQVFLNLARNSERAMQSSPRRELHVEASREGDLVVVRFRDSGPGVARPERLFQPFQSGADAAGLGLYVSRAILRASGGDIRYEPQPAGCCFAVELWPAEDAL